MQRNSEYKMEIFPIVQVTSSTNQRPSPIKSKRERLCQTFVSQVIVIFFSVVAIVDNGVERWTAVTAGCGGMLLSVNPSPRPFLLSHDRRWVLYLALLHRASLGSGVLVAPELLTLSVTHFHFIICPLHPCIAPRALSTSWIAPRQQTPAGFSVVLLPISNSPPVPLKQNCVHASKIYVRLLKILKNKIRIEPRHEILGQISYFLYAAGNGGAIAISKRVTTVRHFFSASSMSRRPTLISARGQI
ncbi:hypothetical protein PUN28_013003 [Cardiocondyla obscurior]|uniref:Uncharacterized protein n=1 Tax=Cardiocondyla obscurior TaxID=286306 RepID=A0AAW2F8X7_9HYME